MIQRTFLILCNNKLLQGRKLFLGDRGRLFLRGIASTTDTYGPRTQQSEKMLMEDEHHWL